MRPEALPLKLSDTTTTETTTPQLDAVLRAKDYQIILLQEQLGQLQPKLTETTEKLRQANQLNELLQKQVNELKAANFKLRDQNFDLVSTNDQLQHKLALLEAQFAATNNDLNALRQTRSVRVSRAVGGTVKRLIGKEK